jgi:predicted nucleic acid-binding protein
MNGDVDLVFVDTNVLLYVIDTLDPTKQEQARLWMKALWRMGRGRISWQVLHKYYSAALRKLKRAPAELRDEVEELNLWNPVSFNLTLIQRAWYWTDHAQTSFWDSLIIAAAEASQCGILLSEDFQPNRKYGPLTVINPFRHSPNEFLS